MVNVIDALCEAGASREMAEEAIDIMTSKGIVFREKEHL